MDDVDTLFPSSQQQDVDTLFPPDVERTRLAKARGEVSPSPIQDYIFGDETASPVARILNEFGQGAKTNWGENSGPQLSPETEDFMKKSGIFNDYKTGQFSITKAANEVLMRGAAVALHSNPLAQIGRVGSAIGSGVMNVLENEAPPVATAVQALNDPGLQVSLEGLGPPGVAAAGVLRANQLFRNLREARELGVIGEGEAGWKGTAPPKPQAEAVKETVAEEPQLPGQPEEQPGQAAAAQPQPEAPQAQPEPQPDIHAVARKIAPEVFTEYDSLAARKNTFHNWIDDLRNVRDENAQANAPHADEIADLQSKLEDTTPRLAKKYQARLAPLLEERDAYIAEQTKADSADMAKIRQRLLETDYRMRDLAPQVSQAYRDAAKQMPEVSSERAGSEVPGTTEAAGVEPTAIEASASATASTEATPEAAATAPAAQEPVAVPAVNEREAAPSEAPSAAPAEAAKAEPKPIEQQRAYIAGDVERQLLAAGRPPEEAAASGALQAAYYETRAARFNGAKGTAEDLYRSEGAQILGQGKRAAVDQNELELAQSKRGSINLLEGRKPIIRLMKDANASTFIHETGHEWLDRLMRDAKDEQAPADLKADAGTVQKWLGVDKAEDIKTRHHEKFARGFETYMMEGRAPSKALASVFAKFKQWLTSIYQTVAKLKAPINDDIRSVFDRFLAQPGEEPVIAPEREIDKGFADKHEAKAEATPPPEADTVGDTVRSERDDIAAEKLVKGNDDRLADIGEEAESRKAGGTQPPDNVDETGPVSGETGTAAQSGTVGEGGSEVAAKGHPAREEPAKPVEPTDPIPQSETRLIDKAGNIRLDNLNTPEDLNVILRDTAEKNNDFMDQRAKVPDAAVLKLAQAAGVDATLIDLKRFADEFGRGQLAAKIRKMRDIFVQSASNVRDLAAKASDGTDADVLAFAEAQERHRMIQGTLSAVTAESGRAMRAFQSIKGMKQATAIGAAISDTTGRELFQIKNAAKKIASLDTPEEVSKFISDSQKKGVFDWLQSTFINALISGPLTHGGYTAAGQMFGLYRAVGRTGAAAFVGKIRELTGLGEEEYARIGEMPQQLYGMFRGNRNGVKAAWQALKSNQTILPAEVERQLELPAMTGQTVNTRETIPNPTIGGVTIPIGKVIEAPGRLVAALHSFNWTTFYSQSMAGQAFRVATKENLEGQAFADRVAQLTQSPTEEMINEGIMDANSGALMQKPAYDSLMGQISRVTNIGWKVPDLKTPLGTIPMGTLRPIKYVDPFVQIQANVQKAAFGDTPLALFSKQVRDDLAMKNGGVAFDRTAGRILAGTSFMLAAGGLASEGLLNHSGPSDPKASRQWQRVYGMPHGLRIGNMSYDVLRLGNLGLQMSVAADLHHAASHLGQDDLTSVASDLVHAFSQNIIDESSMRGPAELMKAVDEHDRYGAAWVRNFLSSAIPFSVGLGQVARQVDPYSRQARTTMDAIKAKLPFISEQLQPRRDIWGEPEPNRGWFGTYNEPIRNDPVDQALLDLHVYPSLPERRIRGVQLTDQQYDDYSRISGRTAKMRLNAIVNAPGYKQMPDAVKLDMITKSVTASRESAADLVMMQNPEIIDAAMKAKRAKVH